MEIVIFEREIYSGGPKVSDKRLLITGKQVLRLSQIFRDMGHEVKLLVSERKKPHSLNFFEFINLGERVDGDVIYSRGSPFCGLFAAILGRRSGLPVVHCIDHLNASTQISIEELRLAKLMPTEGEGFYRYLKLLFRTNPLVNLDLPKQILVEIFYSHIHRFIVSCDYIGECVFKSVRHKENIPTIYPGIDFPQHISVVDPPNVVLFFGSLFSGRGVFDLIQSFSKVVKRDRKVKLLISTYHSHEQTEKLVRYIIAKHGLEDSIILDFTYRDHIFQLINQSRLVCIPFRFPCSAQPPFTILEAMAAARPIITTNVGANREIVADGETGSLVEIGDINQLSDKIIFLLHNTDIAEEFSRKARALIQEKCSWDFAARNTLKILYEASK